MQASPTSTSGPVVARAVVLGPGSVVGTAWLIGLAQGLHHAGLELAEADLIVATSAGAIAAALVTGGRDLATLADISAHPVRDDPLLIDPAVTDHAFAAMREADQDPVRTRQRIGRWALAATTSPETVRIDRMLTLLGTGDWPHPGLVITTVDAESGEPRLWGADDCVPVHLAVTASTAFPGQSAPITINQRRYLDGALRNGSNADLAAGAKTLVIAEPLGHVYSTTIPPGPRQVVRITADRESMDAFGPDFGDRARWAASFYAGLRQAAEAAARVRTAWSG